MVIKIIIFFFLNFNFLITLHANASSQKFLNNFDVRMESIKTSKANLRYGPGKHFPIMWIFKKKKWPIMIIDKHDHWRKIKTINKTTGWMHDSQLSSKKTSIVVFPDFLYKKPSTKAKKIAYLKQNLLIDLIKCKVFWCKIEMENKKFSGWFIKNYLWGTKHIKLD